MGITCIQHRRTLHIWTEMISYSTSIYSLVFLCRFPYLHFPHSIQNDSVEQLERGCVHVAHWTTWEPQRPTENEDIDFFFSFIYFFFKGGFLFIYLFFKFYFIFIFYIIVLVLPNIKINPPQVYMCSPSWTLLPPPSPHHPPGLSQCTSPSIQYRASLTLGWQGSRR